MTRNQLTYHANNEIKRSNLANETRKNLELGETIRHNKETESAQKLASVGTALKGASGYITGVPRAVDSIVAGIKRI